MACEAHLHYAALPFADAPNNLGIGHVHCLHWGLAEQITCHPALKYNKGLKNRQNSVQTNSSNKLYVNS